MSEDQKSEEEMDLLKQHANQLAEHFDTVQIFVTRHAAGELDGTVNANWGAGNWCARYGQIRNWMIKQDERTRMEVQDE